MRVRNVQEMDGAAYLGAVLDQSFLAFAAAWTMAASQFGHRTYDDPGLMLPYMRQLYDDTTDPCSASLLLPWSSDEGADSAEALFAKRLTAVHSVAQIWCSDLQLCTTSITQDAIRRWMVAPSQFVMQGKWKAWSDLAEKFFHKPARIHT